ncbi:Uncharacterised protein [Mycobacterium tuberculosis]|nr:Uncharacterised protein [Mycobacterium tuberculosis]
MGVAGSALPRSISSASVSMVTEPANRARAASTASRWVSTLPW